METWNLFLKDMKDAGINPQQVHIVVGIVTLLTLCAGLYYLQDIFGAESKVAEIFIHPVKSLRGISVLEAVLDDYGFQYDRQYMVVVPDKNGAEGDYSFLTQREEPRLVLIETSLNPISGTLTLAYPRNKPIAKVEIPL
jgi:hypothetical protein